ncbi:MAG: hypothetical protein ACI85O_000020 [Saprospiraceae bacterium]|jgi:hypothetical protein
MSFNKLNFLSLAFLAIFAVALTSCNKENVTLETSENFIDSAITEMQAGAVGRQGCFEFIFPVTVLFDDETTATADDYVALHAAIMAWYETNEIEPTRQNKPGLVFPVQVMSTDGEIIDVASKMELRALKIECRGQFNGPGNCNGGQGHSCFSLVFPITATIGEETLAFEDRESFKDAVRAYKETAGADAERPQLVFPITIEYEDGTQTEIASQEELLAAKEECGN